MLPCLTSVANGVRLAVKVVPGASRDRVVGLLGAALKVAVSKPASGGAANAAVLSLLATTFDVHLTDMSIVAGHSSARKTIEIRGVSGADIEATLRART